MKGMFPSPPRFAGPAFITPCITKMLVFKVAWGYY